MGINSQGVAYNFGQLGSAFADASANTITAPEGMAIVAISFLATNTELSALVAKDANIYPSIGAAAHDRGHQTIQVNGTVSSSATIAFDTTTASLGLKVGDEVYLTATGVLLGTISALNPSTDYNITLSATTSITDDHYISIVTPGKKDGGNEGTGGMAIDASNSFPGGLTIYGRWDSVSLNDNDGAIIAYFGY
tara:strand:- start:1704 stop:2285 length:582 start_codon:yes stop_codon:yes gene_type:complete